MTVPETTDKVDLDQLALRIMAVDYQQHLSSGFRPADDTQVCTTFRASERSVRDLLLLFPRQFPACNRLITRFPKGVNVR